jgi:hypothetical protein
MYVHRCLARSPACMHTGASLQRNIRYLCHGSSVKTRQQQPLDYQIVAENLAVQIAVHPQTRVSNQAAPRPRILSFPVPSRMRPPDQPSPQQRYRIAIPPRIIVKQNAWPPQCTAIPPFLPEGRPLVCNLWRGTTDNVCAVKVSLQVEAWVDPKSKPRASGLGWMVGTVNTTCCGRGSLIDPGRRPVRKRSPVDLALGKPL